MHKNGKDRMCSSGYMIVDRQTYTDRWIDRQTDGQTDEQTDTLITILRAPYRGRSNNSMAFNGTKIADRFTVLFVVQKESDRSAACVCLLG